jgi:hypothetical protein
MIRFVIGPLVLALTVDALAPQGPPVKFILGEGTTQTVTLKVPR